MFKKSKVQMSKKAKVGIGLAIAGFVLAGAGLLWYQQNSAHSKKQDTIYETSAVREGSISSSTLLTGTVKAHQEQYVYYDSSKGAQARPTVSVGEQITVGQQLVQYDKTVAQAAYDAAVRNLNKIGRQINYLKTYGNLPTTTTTIDEETGEETTEVTQPTAQENAQYNQQLQDLNDAYADAKDDVTKAQQALNDTIVVSDVSGTVVEVNADIDPSAKNSQTLVHVATEGQLQIEGTLSEYDLANIASGQAVKVKSKVYPEKEWTGTISYISNYPNQSADTPSGSGNSSAPSYDYKVDLTGDLSGLQQGFTVSVEVVNENKHPLVPVAAVLTENNKNYVWVYHQEDKKINKVEVTLGNADAKQQEILSGLEVGQVVIANPDAALTSGKAISNVVSDTDEDTSSSKSEVKG